MSPATSVSTEDHLWPVKGAVAFAAPRPAVRTGAFPVGCPENLRSKRAASRGLSNTTPNTPLLPGNGTPWKSVSMHWCSSHARISARKFPSEASGGRSTRTVVVCQVVATMPLLVILSEPMAPKGEERPLPSYTVGTRHAIVRSIGGVDCLLAGAAKLACFCATAKGHVNLEPACDRTLL